MGISSTLTTCACGLVWDTFGPLNVCNQVCNQSHPDASLRASFQGYQQRRQSKARRWPQPPPGRNLTKPRKDTKLSGPRTYRTNDYALGLKKPRRTQIAQRLNSSRSRGIVPAWPARCLRWSPNVQMPASSGTRIGAVSSAVRGVDVLCPLLLIASRGPVSSLSFGNMHAG